MQHTVLEHYDEMSSEFSDDLSVLLMIEIDQGCKQIKETSQSHEDEGLSDNSILICSVPLVFKKEPHD